MDPDGEDEYDLDNQCESGNESDFEAQYAQRLVHLPPQGDEDEDEDEGNAEVVVKDHFTDKEGLIRVGPQLLRFQQTIRTAPLEVMDSWLIRSIRANLRRTDAKLPGHKDTLIENLKSDIAALLRSTFTHIEDQDRYLRLDDYAGTYLSWAPGPMSPSMEAIYHFAVSGGRFDYHTPQNIAVIGSSMNRARRQHPPLTLACAAVGLRIAEESIFVIRKAQLSWVYNALCNSATLGKVFGCIQPHVDQIANWSAWDEPTQRAALEALRTGIRNETVDNFLEQWQQAELFRITFQKYSDRGRWSRPQASVYQTLLQIAARYDLSKADFEYLCTIASPRSSNDRVFFPFHVLSRPQALSIGWDWSDVFNSASEKKSMRKYCNKHAEAAGLGEPHVDAEIFVYWMAAYTCRRIQDLRQRWPAASKDEIAFGILDRWGLPIVPWVGNILRASICKDQDHGIAMRFGIVTRDDQPFNPVEDIDLSCCTIAIDTQLTNMAMKNYPRESWPSIRANFCQVPLHHPFWRIDPSVGSEVWGAEGIKTSSLPPTPEFDVALLPVEAWLQGDVEHQHNFSCLECGSEENSAGSLIRHMREHHGKVQMDDEGPVAAAKAIDDEHWASAFKFPCREKNCTKVCATKASRRGHEKTHSAHRPTFFCRFKKCGLGFSSVSNRRKHERAKHGLDASGAASQAEAPQVPASSSARLIAPTGE